MKQHVLDLIDRAAATFAQAFLAIEIGDQTGITQLSSLKVAAIAGGLAVAKWAFVKLSAYNGSQPSVPAKPAPPAA